MIFADDALMAPVKSILWIFREIHQAAVEELNAEEDRIRAELARIYQQLEQGNMTDDEFDAREAELLDRLDVLEGLSESEEESDEDELEDES